MNKSDVVNGLGLQNLIDYVLNRSTLKKEQFVFAQLGKDGRAHFLVAKDNVIVDLGECSYDRFIRGDNQNYQPSIVAISRFLNLCIEKLKDPSISVPALQGNPDGWDDYYKRDNP